MTPPSRSSGSETECEELAQEVLGELEWDRWLIALAKEVAVEAKRGEVFTPPLGMGELAVHDALRENESALNVMGADGLAKSLVSW